MPLYRMSLEEQDAADFAMASWFVSTHPESPLVRSKVVARVEPGVRWTLFDRELRTRKGGEVDVRALTDDDSFHAALRDVFGIDLGAEPGLRW